MKRVISSPGAPRPIGPYSQATTARGRAIFVAGQVALDPATGRPVEGGIEVQTARVLETIGVLLAAAGASYSDVVKVTVFIQSWDDFPKMNEVYARFFGPELPARTTAQTAMPPGFLLEMDATAYVD